MTDPHESIHRGYIALLRALRDKIDNAISALEQFESCRVSMAGFAAEKHTEPEHEPEREPEPVEAPRRDRIADGRPARIRYIMQSRMGHLWTAQEMGAALQDSGFDGDLHGPVLHRRIAATFASMGDVERTARGRYRLAVKAGTNGGSEPTSPASAPRSASPR